MTTTENPPNLESVPSRRSFKGHEFSFNFGGFLKRFKITSENDKDQEILTLANLDSGYIRKFIIKKVDESSLFGRKNSSKSLKSEGRNNSSNSLRKKERREKREAKEAKKRRLSTGSIQSACSYKSTKSAVSVKSFKSEAGGLKKKKKKHSFGRGKFKIGWGSEDSDSLEVSDVDDFDPELSIMTAKDLEEKEDPGFINPAYVKESLEDEGVGSLGKEEDSEGGKEEKEEKETDKDELIRDRSDGDGSSETGSLSSLDSGSPVGSPKFNLRMSPRPKKRDRKRESPPSPVSFRSGYQSNRSSVSSVRKGILKKSTSSTTINMEMNNLSRPHTPTDDGEEDDEDIPRFVRSKTMTKSFNRVKFILDSGRPDNITGDYNDIKIEKVDKSLSSDRSLKSQDDSNQSGLSKSGKKCLIFSAGVLVLTMAVILGSFFGSRKTSSHKAAFLASQYKYISNAAEGSFKIINENWGEQLRDVESAEFKKMSKGLEEALLTAIFLNATGKTANSTANIKVIKYEEGIKSVFRIKWTPNINIPIAEIKKRAVRHLNKYGALGEYKVDKSSFAVEDLKDSCKHLECSNNCTFSVVTLQFKCTCPENLVLANNRNCVTPKSQSPAMKTAVRIPDVINEVLKTNNATFLALNQETVDKSSNATVVDKSTPKDNADGAKSEESKIQEEENEINTDKEKKTSPVLEKKSKEESLKDLKGRSEIVLAGNYSSNSSQSENVANSTLSLQEPSITDNSTGKVAIELQTANTTISSNKTDDKMIVIQLEDAAKSTNGTLQLEDTPSEENITTVESIIKAAEEPVLPTELPTDQQILKSDEKNDNASAIESGTLESVDHGNTTTVQQDKVINASEKDASQNITLDNSGSGDNSTSESSIHGDELAAGTMEPPLNNATLQNDSNMISKSNISKEETNSPASTVDSKVHSPVNSTPETLDTEMVSDLTGLNTTTVTDITETLLGVNSTAVVDKHLPSANDETEESLVEVSSPEENKMLNETILESVNETERHEDEQLSSIKPVTLEPEIYMNVDTNINEVPHTDLEEKATMVTGSTTVESAISGMTTNVLNVQNTTYDPHRLTETVTEAVVAYILNKGEKLNRTTPVFNNTDIVLPLETDINTTDTKEDMTLPRELPPTQELEEMKKKEVVTIKGIPLSDVSPPTISVSSETPFNIPPPTTPPLIAILFPSTSILEPNVTSIENQTSFQIDFGLIANVSHDLSIPIQTSKEQDIEIPSENATIHLISTSSNDSTANITTNTTTTTIEPEIQCDEGKFSCGKQGSPFGSCLPFELQCDSVFNCYDQSDEKDCVENKCLANYQCRWSGDCLSRKFVCDGVKQCTGGDDEELCETRKCNSDEFKCKIGNLSTCLPLSKQCDGHSDCFNHTDEINCTSECSKEKFLCPEGMCIPNLWKCDGNADCLGGEDEADCGCEGLDQSPCAVGGCVPTFKLCDGLRQCPDGSDEWGCIKIENETKLLQIRSSEGRWSSVCGDKWTAEWTDLVCAQLGLGVSLSTEVKRVTESVPRARVKLSSDAPEVSRRGKAPLQYFLTNGACPNDPLVHVSCKTPQCGNWTYDSSKATLHNKQSKADEEVWPSLGLLIQPETYANKSMTYNFACTATIITPIWVIASYSCLESKTNGFQAEKWAFLIGEKSPKAGEGKTQLRYAKQVVTYPGAKRIEGLWSGDAVLLRLRTPVTLDETTQPVCLSDTPAGSHDQCLIATWKSLQIKTENGLEEGRSQNIQDLPIPNLTVNTCNTSYYEGHLRPGHGCASFLQDKHSKCTGNEGSPLMCRKKDGTWFLQGLLSHKGNCASFNLPSVFTDASSIQSWVLSTIGRPQMASTNVKQTSTTSTRTPSTTPTSVDSLNGTTISTLSPQVISVHEQKDIINNAEEEKTRSEVSVVQS